MPFSDVKITKSGNLGQIQSTRQDRIDFLCSQSFGRFYAEARDTRDKRY